MEGKIDEEDAKPTDAGERGASRRRQAMSRRQATNQNVIDTAQAEESGPVGAPKEPETLFARRQASRGRQPAVDGKSELKLDIGSVPTPVIETKPTLALDTARTNFRSAPQLASMPNIPTIIPPTQDPSKLVVMQPTAAAEFAKISASVPEPPQPASYLQRASGTVYEESVATGAFRKTQIAAASSYGAVNDTEVVSVPGAQDEEALSEPTQNISPALMSGFGHICTYAQGLLTGLCLAQILVIQQYSDATSATSALSVFVDPLRFAAYVLATLAWLNACNMFMQHRTKTLPAKNLSQYVWIYVLCQSLVLATVFATLPLDKYLQLYRVTPQEADDVQRHFQAWKVLLWLRFAFCALGNFSSIQAANLPTT